MRTREVWRYPPAGRTHPARCRCCRRFSHHTHTAPAPCYSRAWPLLAPPPTSCRCSTPPPPLATATDAAVSPYLHPYSRPHLHHQPAYLSLSHLLQPAAFNTITTTPTAADAADAPHSGPPPPAARRPLPSCSSDRHLLHISLDFLFSPAPSSDPAQIQPRSVHHSSTAHVQRIYTFHVVRVALCGGGGDGAARLPRAAPAASQWDSV